MPNVVSTFISALHRLHHMTKKQNQCVNYFLLIIPIEKALHLVSHCRGADPKSNDSN